MDTPCWIALVQRRPKVKINGRDVYLYRAVYELIKGPIPEGLTIDHLCRDPRCWNPDHLEPVTFEENRRRAGFARAETCVNGHPKTADNVIPQRGNGWKCKTCHREIAKRSYHRRQAENLHT